MRTRKRNGFTLVELLITLAILALIMAALLATLQSTVRAHDEAEVEISSVRDGPRILDMIERDLRAIHVYNLKDGNVLRGRSERPGGLRGDRVDFVCCNDSARRVPDPSRNDPEAEDIASDLNEVGYRLRSSALSDDFIELWRREDLFVDDEPFEGGAYEKVHDRVRRFEITYLNHLGEKAEEKTEWDMLEEKRLPGAVRIDLDLQASPELVGGFIEVQENALRVYRYTRVIAFPEDETVALAVRPYLPTKITGRNDNGGANGPGAGGGKGEGGENSTQIGAGGSPDGAGATPDGPAGGGSLKEFMEKGGRGGGRRERFDFTSGEGPVLDVNPGQDGQLSEQDQQKIEDFLNDYRNRYSGRGGSGFPGSPAAGSGGR